MAEHNESIERAPSPVLGAFRRLVVRARELVREGPARGAGVAHGLADDARVELVAPLIE